MNYKKIHDKIIENRRILGKPVGYSENHHIIPESFGGSNDSSNMIRLTAKEHFIIHRLLSKIYPNSGMVHAIYKMACVDKHWGSYKVTSRTYDYLRAQHAKRVSEDSEAARKKSESLKGRKQTEEHIKKRAESRKNNNSSWLSEETKRKIGESNKGKDGTWKGKTLPEDMIKKRNATRHLNNNYKQSEETKKKISDTQKGRKLGPKSEENIAKQRKTYLVNSEIVVTNAKQYCLENGLRYQKFISAANNGNTYKGLLITKIEIK